MKILKKTKTKTTGDIIISHKCNINAKHMMYGSWDIKHDRQNVLSFWAIFCPFTPLKIQKIKILKKWRKQLEISSFHTYVHKIMIICYTVPKIWRMADAIIFHFGLFFALFSPNSPKKYVWRYHFTRMYQKSWSYAILLLRYAAWWV